MNASLNLNSNFALTWIDKQNRFFHQLFYTECGLKFTLRSRFYIKGDFNSNHADIRYDAYQKSITKLEPYLSHTTYFPCLLLFQCHLTRIQTRRTRCSSKTCEKCNVMLISNESALWSSYIYVIFTYLLMQVLAALSQQFFMHKVCTSCITIFTRYISYITHTVIVLI